MLPLLLNVADLLYSYLYELTCYVYLNTIQVLCMIPMRSTRVMGIGAISSKTPDLLEDAPSGTLSVPKRAGLPGGARSATRRPSRTSGLPERAGLLEGAPSRTSGVPEGAGLPEERASRKARLPERAGVPEGAASQKAGPAVPCSATDSATESRARILPCWSRTGS